MPMSDAEIQRTLGQLLEKAENIEKATAKADESRKVMHHRMDQMHLDVVTLQADMQAVKRQQAKQGVITDEVVRWKQMGIGALAIMGIGGTAVGVFIAGALEKIVHFLRG